MLQVRSIAEQIFSTHLFVHVNRTKTHCHSLKWFRCLQSSSHDPSPFASSAYAHAPTPPQSTSSNYNPTPAHSLHIDDVFAQSPTAAQALQHQRASNVTELGTTFEMAMKHMGERRISQSQVLPEHIMPTLDQHGRPFMM